jgi:hypothetical protein
MSGGTFVLTVLFPRAEEEAVSPEALEAPARRAAPTAGTTPGASLALDVAAALPGMGTVDDAAGAAVAGLNACAADSAAFAPLDGRLTAVVEVGAGGLQAATVPNVASLTPTAAGCVSAALVAAGWPAVDGDPLRVTLPFYVVQPRGPEPLRP